MKLISVFIFVFLLSACSFNENSNYWNEHNNQRIVLEKKLNKILKKSEDITLMTMEEYKIYIDDYTKKSEYPNIEKWKKM